MTKESTGQPRGSPPGGSIRQRVHTRSHSAGIMILGGSVLLEEAQFRRFRAVR